MSDIPDQILIEGWMVIALRGGRWKRCTSNANGVTNIIFDSESAVAPAILAAMKTDATDVRVVRVSGRIDVVEAPNPAAPAARGGDVQC